MKELFKRLLSLVLIISMTFVSFGATEYNLSDEIERAKVVTQYGDVSVDEIDTALFGSYYQSDEYTKEPIEWIVLEKDRINRKALLLSKYILDTQQYNYNEDYDSNWEACQLKVFLDNEFLVNAFNESERTKIIEEDGINYLGKAFLLDNEQMKKYFPNQAQSLSFSGLVDVKDVIYLGTKSATKGTNYAKSRGLGTFVTPNNIVDKAVVGAFDFFVSQFFSGVTHAQIQGCSDYWNASHEKNGQAFATKVGCLIEPADSTKLLGVRPAIWVSY